MKKQLNLDDVLSKAKENYEWDDKTAEQALEWHVKHWYLCIKYLTIPLAAKSKAADDLWHQHIIDTRKYATDCQQIAGMFLNHTPIYESSPVFEESAYDSKIEFYNEDRLHSGLNYVSRRTYQLLNA